MPFSIVIYSYAWVGNFGSQSFHYQNVDKIRFKTREMMEKQTNLLQYRCQSPQITHNFWNNRDFFFWEKGWKVVIFSASALMNQYKKVIRCGNQNSATQWSWRRTALWLSLLCDGVYLSRTSMWDEWHKCWQKFNHRFDIIEPYNNQYAEAHPCEGETNTTYWCGVLTNKKTDLKHTARRHGLTVTSEERHT